MAQCEAMRKQDEEEAMAASAAPTPAREASFGEKARVAIKSLGRSSSSSAAASLSSASTRRASPWGRSMTGDELVLSLGASGSSSSSSSSSKSGKAFGWGRRVSSFSSSSASAGTVAL